MVSMPRQITNMLSSQKEKKQIQMAAGDCRAGQTTAQHGGDGLAADPRLNAEPAAGDQGAQHAPGMFAPRTPNEARTRTGNGMPYFVPACALSSIGHQDDEIAEQDRADGLPPVHAAGDQSRGQHVGGNADAHGDPEGGVVVDIPGALFGRDGREVGVEEAGIGPGTRKQLSRLSSGGYRIRHSALHFPDGGSAD